jgi:phytoene synthase
MSWNLRESYAHCRQIARQSASSFYYSFMLLPKRKRMAMCALYAFLRRTDDLGDSNAPAGERRNGLASWRIALASSLDGQHSDPLLPALADTVRAFQIPPEYLNDVIDGVEMDLEPVPYQTFEQLERYCQRVASAVGLACIRIWGTRTDRAEEPARRCGLAFQLTNILRDLREDALRDRVYLPQQDLDRFGYSAAELRQGVYDDRFRRLMRFEIDRTERLYDEARALEPWLDADGRRIFGSMVAVYRALLDEIKRMDGDVLSNRVRLSRWRKMRIASRYLLRPHFERAAGIVMP